ncbi:cytochrome P450 [Actinoallomurus purpureus]|uniref:cytochrome P450 family protein n=1 Tax=Actinoallomurus purpureus TaxID=478114 RepID=UPI00209235C0|nr:cytochrome P450 [Actinoallomurus purpureus]MCO6005604.1 cytochrome P450 [Actinoallomurus purpureus]
MGGSRFPFPAPGEPILDTYARLREAGPVVPIELPDGVPAWAVNSYDALVDLLSRDNKVFSADPRHWTALHDGSVPPDWPMRPLVAGDHVQVKDGVDHRRLRTLISRAFTPSRVEALKPRISELAATLVDGIAAAGDGVDLVSAFTEPLPMSVICDLYGVPLAERAQIRGWTTTLLAHTSTGEQAAAANEALNSYLASLVELKRREPGDDLTTGLVQAHDDEDHLSDDELVSALWVMLIAGHETTVHLLGNAVVALSTHPDQRTLAIEQDRWPQVVEETLRYRGSVIGSPFRYTLTDTTLAGVPIPAGEALWLSLANHGTDRERYGDTADRFDITREQTGHLAFGFGPHFCVGAPLARLESRIALSALFGRFPELTLAADVGTLAYTPSAITYGPLSLPVRLGPAPDRAAERRTPEPA